MSYGSHSDEVAEDYKRALEDLNMNSRYEISNLTVIAKENNEHALAISEALKDHIKRVAPVKKLPAFYVLDSIVKNVGTPYTLFFGRGLYQTFMEAYALVDTNTRKKMEEMLKTWKEPVPGSMDTRPVFPADVTKPIENALIRARTAAIQREQEYARQNMQSRGGRPIATPYRDTPTPPNGMRAASNAPQFPPGYPTSQYPPNGNPQPYGNQQYGQNRYPTPQAAPLQGFVPPNSDASAPWQRNQGSNVPEASLENLQNDIARLIAVSKEELSRNLYNSGVQTRLKALLDLQQILSSQRLPPDQLAMVRDQVAQLSVAAQASSRVQPAPAPPPVVNPPPVVPATIAPQQPSLSSLLGAGASGALAALLARQSSTPQVPTPPPPQPVLPVVQSPSLQYAPPPAIPPQIAAPPTDPGSLLEKLRAAGLLPPMPAANGVAPPIPGMMPPTASTPVLMPNSRPPLGRIPIPNDVQLTSASLKIPRPHLISALYERLGAPCSQCGRRFQSDEEGKKKKTAHLDWHFRVNQRMAETEKRGQHRSWFVDEMDWIKSRENDAEQLTASGATGNDSNAAAAASAPKQSYLAVPDDPAMAHSLCPICQEKFEMKWLDDAQEFVWMDAVKLGDRIYHASCHSEAKKDGGSTPAYQRSTPEPVLGKRKAEEDHFALRGKTRSDTYSA